MVCAWFRRLSKVNLIKSFMKRTLRISEPLEFLRFGAILEKNKCEHADNIIHILQGIDILLCGKV